MRAAVLSDHGLAVREWPDPEPGSGEALVEVSAAGICGSDVHFAIDGGAQTAFRPIILGHETAGRVAALGPDTDGPEVGTRVAIIPIVTCRECAACRAGRSVICELREVLGADRHGSWCDRLVVPARNVLPIPYSLSDGVAAVATDAVATAYHAVATRGGVDAGSRVAIWGSGGLGVCGVAIARAMGASIVIAVDPRPDARARAIAAGADDAIAPEDARERMAALRGVDVALEFVGTVETVEQAVRSLAPGGRAVAVGMGPGVGTVGPLITMVARERELVGSLGSEPEEVAAVLAMLSDGTLRIPDLIGDVVTLEEAPAGLQRLRHGQVAEARIVIDVASGRRC
jgi:2-desacetyl-2-hydroxyethyl bacteriochlorophyllide A dehydrogenase